MTTTQASELEQAIRRAQRDGITILAHGTRKSDGARVWGVTSTRMHDYRLHQVVQVAGRLLCDCPSRVICKHRGLVHLALAAERADACEREIEQPLHEAAQALHMTLETTPAPATRDNPRLLDDTRGISIFKL